MNEKASWLLRGNKTGILVIIAPNFSTEKGWLVDVCNNYKIDREDTALKERLEALQRIDEDSEALQGYATNLPGFKRSNDYM